MYGVYGSDGPSSAEDLEQILGQGARAGGGGPPFEGARWSPGPAFGAVARAHQPAARQGADRPKFGAGVCPVFEPSEADLEWVRERVWGGGGGPPAEGAHRDPGLGALAGAHTADRPKFGGGLSPAFEPSEADLEWVCKRVGGGSARARRLGTPHRPPAQPICAPRARRTRDGDDARRSCVRRPSPIAEVPPPIVAGGAGMGAPGTRSPGVASPPSRPPGSTAEWRQRQASPGLHRTLPSRRGGVADNPSPFAGGGAMLARTSARSPAGATPSYSPPGSAMVSRQGQTSPGLLHPPPSRGGGGANSADAPWRATRDSPPVGGGSPGPQRAGGASQVVPRSWILPSAFLDAPHVALGGSSGGGGPLGAGALGFGDVTRQPNPAPGGGGVDVGVPRVGGATFRDSSRGGLRRSGRRKVPPAAQVGDRMDYLRTPPPQLPHQPGCREQQPPCETLPPLVTCGGEG